MTAIEIKGLSEEYDTYILTITLDIPEEECKDLETSLDDVDLTWISGGEDYGWRSEDE